MDVEQFRKHGHDLINFIADYYQNIESYPVVPDIKPNQLRHLVPTQAPMEGEKFEDIMADVQRLIMPNITHWQHPNFFAFFPANTSYPAILGELLSAGLGVQGMMWVRLRWS